MTSSARAKMPIVEKLEYDYLINDDVTSLNTLISLLDESNIKFRYEKTYKIKDYILKNLQKYFYNIVNIDQVIECVDKSIGKDLDKFEYLLAIKAEHKACFDKRNIDELECTAIEYYGASFLFENNCIFEDDSIYSLEIKESFKEKIKKNRKLVAKLNSEITDYSYRYLKHKILNLDVNTNKQLAFNFDNIYTDDISLEQSNKINKKIVNYLYNSSLEIYADYYWKGLAKEVINRYH